MTDTNNERGLSSDKMHSTTPELTLCLEEIKAQSEEALSQFYDLTINKVYGLALRITGHTEEAEEVVSDVYLQIWEQAGRYQPEKASIMTWLLTICRSRAIDRIRKRQLSSSEQSSDNTAELIATISNPEFLLSNTQQHSLIHNAIKKLSSEQRQLLSLAFFRGLTYQEIAIAINMPLGTVKSHIRRSLIELKAEPSLQFSFAIDGETHHG